MELVAESCLQCVKLTTRVEITFKMFEIIMLVSTACASMRTPLMRFHLALGHDKAQDIIDQITAAHESGAPPPPGAFNFGPPPPLPGMGGFPGGELLQLRFQ